MRPTHREGEREIEREDASRQDGSPARSSDESRFMAILFPFASDWDLASDLAKELEREIFLTDRGVAREKKGPIFSIPFLLLTLSCEMLT